MTTEPKDLAVENALLRGSLWLTARALKDYKESPRKKIEVDGLPMLEVTIRQSLHDKAAEALARADKMLKDEGRTR